jgi:hypothetical protein
LAFSFTLFILSNIVHAQNIQPTGFDVCVHRLEGTAAVRVNYIAWHGPWSSDSEQFVSGFSNLFDGACATKDDRQTLGACFCEVCGNFTQKKKKHMEDSNDFAIFIFIFERRSEMEPCVRNGLSIDRQ